MTEGSRPPRPAGPGTPFPPLLLFVLFFAGGVLLDQLASLPMWPAKADDVWSTAGVVLAASGALLFAWGLGTFARARTGILLQRPATRVVAHGPYRWSRNPMYVACVVLYLGAAMLVNSLWPVLLLPGAIALLTELIIAREEHYMHATFGKDYDGYCQRVPRWL